MFLGLEEAFYLPKSARALPVLTDFWTGPDDPAEQEVLSREVARAAGSRNLSKKACGRILILLMVR